jgi:hypothetical protein
VLISALNGVVAPHIFAVFRGLVGRGISAVIGLLNESARIVVVEQIGDRIVTVCKVLKIRNTAAPSQLDAELLFAVRDISNVLGGHFACRN